MTRMMTISTKRIPILRTARIPKIMRIPEIPISPVITTTIPETMETTTEIITETAMEIPVP